MTRRPATFGYAGSLAGRWQGRGVEALEWATLAKPRLLWRLRHVIGGGLPHGLALPDAALSALGIAVAIDGLDRLPETGPCVIVANHPTGVLDGAALLSGLSPRRGDVRIVARALASDLPQVAPLLLSVPYDHAVDRRAALRSLVSAAHAHLSQGGAVALFPAGRIAESDEGPWSDTGLRLARAFTAPLVPVRILRSPSAAYRGAARLHPVLRQGVLLNEVLHHANRPFHMRMGAPIDPTGLTAARLRDVTLAL